jgi:putative PEP-CTERM system TPR-repeat lipoprotein
MISSFRARCRLLTLLGLVTAVSGLQASPEKASKFYDDARVRYERRDLPGAALQLKNALQEDRHMLAAHLLLGRVLFEVGQLQAAEVALQEAMRQGVAKSEVLPLLGRVYLKLGEPTKLLDQVDPSGMPPALRSDLLTLRGSAQAMIGNLAAASTSFEQARAADPRSAEPLVAEAPVLLRFGEAQKAEAAALKATQLAPDNAMAWHQLGNIAQALGNRKQALEAQDRAIAIAPKLVDAYVAKATLLVGAGRREEAAALLDQLKQWNVMEPRASYLRGVLLASAQDLPGASAAWAEAINLIDPMPPALRASSEPLLLAGALSHRALGNTEKAREYIETLLARNPRHLAGRVLLASVLVDAGDVNKAKPVVDELLRRAPDEPQVLYLAGRLELARRQYEQAQALFERAQAAGGGNAALRELALSQSALGQPAKALAALEKVIAKDPGDLRATIELAIAYARAGQGKKAVDLAESMVSKSPDDPERLNFLGNIHGRLGDEVRMRSAYERALAKGLTYRPAVVNLSRLDLDQGRLDAARTRLTSWTKDHPKDAEALYFLGVAERRSGRAKEAMEAWERADVANPRDPRASMARVDLLLEQRRADDAIKVARALVANNGSLVSAHHVLARTHMALQQRELARSVLKEALKIAGFEAEPIVATGRLMLAIADVDGADYAASKALQAQPADLGALLLATEVAGRRGNAAAVDKAMAELQARHRGAPPVLLTAGHIAMSRQQYPAAVTAYQQAYDKEPSPPVALLRSRALLAARQPERALDGLLEARKRFNDDDLLLRGSAEIKALLGKTAEAVVDFEALVKKRPGDAELQGSFAELLFGLKDPRALPMAEAAMKADPGLAAHAARYGWMLVLSGKVADGVRALRDARLRDPSDGRIRWQLAEGLLRMGNQAEARDELRAALSSANPPRPGAELDRMKRELGL